MDHEKHARKLIMTRLPKFRFYVIFSFCMALFIQLIGLIPPILMQKVIDTYIPEKDLQGAILCIVLFVAIPILTTIFSTAYNYALSVAGRNMGQDLNIMGFEKLIRQPCRTTTNIILQKLQPTVKVKL